ncbi:MAG: HD domain-containing protein [Candidatus Hodarchaeota archaeon]
MVRKSLILKLFDAFSIQRWNDKIRPVELTEMDKNAHKMVIAYCLGKYEEQAGNDVNWLNIIKGGIYELLRRVVISDIKSPVYRKIKNDHQDVFIELNKWVFEQLEPCIDNDNVKSELRKYLLEENILDYLSDQILAAAHIYASYWEFQIIRQTNPSGYQISDINRLLLNDIEKHLNLTGIQKIITRNEIADFVDLVGQLRFQIRWSHTPIIPATSVLGHSMMVACLAYFFSLEISACDKRITNNFFGGLFHDLPEAVTRDIISPVKGAVPELPDVIRGIERELVKKEIYPLIEKEWLQDFEYFTKDEFKSKIIKDGSLQLISSDDINKDFNDNAYFPIDGELIEVVDHLAAFVEAYKASEAGIRTPQLEEGMHQLKSDYKGKTIGGLNIGATYADF